MPDPRKIEASGSEGETSPKTEQPQNPGALEKNVIQAFDWTNETLKKYASVDQVTHETLRIEVSI